MQFRVGTIRTEGRQGYSGRQRTSGERGSARLTFLADSLMESSFQGVTGSDGPPGGRGEAGDDVSGLLSCIVFHTS